MAIGLLAVIALTAAGSRLLWDFHFYLPAAVSPKTSSSASAASVSGPPARLPAANSGRQASSGSRPHQAVQANGSPREQQMISFNNQGVEAVGRKDYWRAVYFFEKASKLEPRRPEPLINLGVVLIKLGFPAPALRAFEKAYAVAPADPRLKENLDLLAGAGLIEGPLAKAVAPGGQTAVAGGGG